MLLFPLLNFTSREEHLKPLGFLQKHGVKIKWPCANSTSSIPEADGIPNAPANALPFPKLPGKCGWQEAGHLKGATSTLRPEGCFQVSSASKTDSCSLLECLWLGSLVYTGKILLALSGNQVVAFFSKDIWC